VYAAEVRGDLPNVPDLPRVLGETGKAVCLRWPVGKAGARVEGKPRFVSSRRGKNRDARGGGGAGDEVSCEGWNFLYLMRRNKGFNWLCSASR